MDEMKLDINNLKRKIDDYFANITAEQLQQDLIEAGSEVYSKSDFNILDPFSQLWGDNIDG